MKQMILISFDPAAEDMDTVLRCAEQAVRAVYALHDECCCAAGSFSVDCCAAEDKDEECEEHDAPEQSEDSNNSPQVEGSDPDGGWP